MIATIKTREHNYKFSFVMAAFNVELYIEETIECILAQTLNFEENCEIIIVNDGSTDKTESICIKYKNKYPDNIRYIKQHNGGVSEARNRGIENVTGEYVTFLDPDDLISPNTLELVFKFLNTNKSKIDFATIPIMMFEAVSGEHVLNGQRFERGSRIIDIKKEPWAIHFSAAASFIKSEILNTKNGYHFDSKLRRFGEDMKLMTEIILDKQKYGVIAGPVYYYRRRNNGDSSTGLESESKEWYTFTLNEIHCALIDKSLKDEGSVSKYLQYVLLQDIQRRFKRELPSQLTVADVSEYKQKLADILWHIDDDTIKRQKNMYQGYKLYMLGVKYGDNIFEATTSSNELISYRGNVIYNYRSSKREMVHIKNISLEAGKVLINARLSGFLFKGYSLILELDGEKQAVNFLQVKNELIFSLGDVVNSGHSFSTRLHTRRSTSLSFYIVNGKFKKLVPVTIEDDRISKRDPFNFFFDLGRYTVQSSERGILILNQSKINKVLRRAKRLIGR